MNGILWFKHSPLNGPSVDLISPMLIKQWFHFSTSSLAPLLGSRSAAWLVSQHTQIWIKGGRTTRQRRVCWYPFPVWSTGPQPSQMGKRNRWSQQASCLLPAAASFGAWQSHTCIWHTCTHTHPHAHTHRSIFVIFCTVYLQFNDFLSHLLKPVHYSHKSLSHTVCIVLCARTTQSTYM